MLVENLPSLETEFNILLPVYIKPNTVPESVTLVFFDRTRTVDGVTSLLNPIKAYRLSGAVVAGAIAGAITKFNSLAVQTPATALTADFTANWVLQGGDVFSYGLDTVSISPTATSNTFTAGASNSITGYTAGTPFGAGLTISFFRYSVFGVGSLTLASGSSNIDCPYFKYLYR